MQGSGKVDECRPKEIIFTSGATEGDSLGMSVFEMYAQKVIILLPVQLNIKLFGYL
jgi:cysteine sulfinate desulfinase/cysteine desulfurase-like protein